MCIRDSYGTVHCQNNLPKLNTPHNKDNTTTDVYKRQNMSRVDMRERETKRESERVLEL